MIEWSHEIPQNRIMEKQKNSEKSIIKNLKRKKLKKTRTSNLCIFVIGYSLVDIVCFGFNGSSQR